MTDKQKKFVEAKLKGKSGIQAVKDAGYDIKDDNSAKVIASKNLTKVNIKAELDARNKEIEQNTNWTVAKLVQEHENLKQKAIDKGDLATATRNIELIGKTIAAYSDNLNTTDVTRAQELAKSSQDEAEELRRLANIRLSAMKQVKTG